VTNSDDVKQFSVRATALVTAWLFFVGQVQAQGQSIPQIVPDGQTLTNLQINGATTDITTQTLMGGNGINSFNKFDVYSGNTVNLHVPNQANNLLNLVHQNRSQIDGILNGYKNGAIGGNVFFLNPHGLVVGATGVINANQVHLMAPNASDMQAMLQGTASQRLTAMQAIQEGRVPVSSSGLITIQGQVNALDKANIQGQSVNLSGSVNAGQAGAVNLASAVNMGAVQAAQVLHVSSNGDVFIGAAQNIDVSGHVNVDAVTQNANAGRAIVMAQDTSTLHAQGQLSANAIGGNAGFVEFSAKDTVILAGGSLSAASITGTDGEVLIDPENIVLAAHLLRGSGVSTPGGATWNAGSLTLQATSSITVNANQVVSSRQVASPTSVSSHQADASTGNSGDLIIQAPSISMLSGSALLAHASGDHTAGDVTLTATSNGASSISLAGAIIKGANVVLNATGTTEGAFIALNPLATASASINVSNSSAITATGNVDITATALQAKPIFSGIIVQLDARTARADVDLVSSSITGAGNINLNANADVFTDLSPDGFTGLENDLTNLAASSLSPVSIGVAVTTSYATMDLSGSAAITSTGGSVVVASKAQTDSSVAAESTATGGAITTAISIITNTAATQLAGTSNISATGTVDVTSKGKAQVDSIADSAVVSAQGSGGSVAVAVTSLNNSITTLVKDAAQISASSATNIHADAINTINTAARAGVGSAVNNAGNVLDEQMGSAGIDADTRANLKTGFEGSMNKIMDKMDNTSGGGSSVQMAGGLSFANIINVTKAEVTATVPATDSVAPVITSTGLASVQARAVTQANSMGSGKTKKATYGGGAGVGFMNGSNTVNARIQGAVAQHVNINSNGLSVKALTQSYDTSVVATHMNKFGAQAYAGQQASGENGIGLAGAVAIGILETNNVVAEIAADTTINANDGDVAVEATNHTENKVEADGRPRKKNAVDAMFSLYNSLDEDGSAGGGKAKLGIGASIAVATSQNLAHAKIDGDTLITNIDDLTVDANQSGATEAEANSAGSGGIAIVPIAAVTVARDTATAELLTSSNGLTTGGITRVQALQDVSSKAVGSGTAGNDSANADVGIGLSVAVNVALTTATATVDRNVAATGDVTIKASSQRASSAGATASVNSASGDYDTDREEGSKADVTTSIGKLVGLGNSMSGESTDASAVQDKASTDKDGNSGSSDETSLSLAAALGINYVENTTAATVSANRTISGANIVVQSENNTDAEALADGSAGSGASDYNIAGAIGLNIVTLNNTATLSTGASLSGVNVTVRAKTRDTKDILDDDGNDTGENDTQNVLKAEAQAGAGVGNFSLAGAAAINVILANNNKALLQGTSTTNATGNVVVNANANTLYRTFGSGKVGDERPTIGSLKDSFSSFDDLVVRVGKTADAIKGHIDTAKSNQAAAPDAGDNPDEEGDSGSGTGIGASFSINVITSEKTQAEIEDGAIFSVGGTLGVEASGESTLETQSEAGAAPTGDPTFGEEQQVQKNALDAAVAVGVLVDKDVIARIGTGSTSTVGGNISVSGVDVTNTLVTTDGKSVGDKAAVGAAVSVSVVIDDVTAHVARSLTSTTGTIGVVTDADSTDVVKADAMARGAVVERWQNKFNAKAGQSFTENDILTGGFKSGDNTESGPTSSKALSGDFSGGTGATTKSVSKTGGDDASKSQSINIAAAVSVNVVDHDSSASLADGITLISAGDVTVSATNDLNYQTRGSGLTVFSDTGIGVGVAILVTNNSTTADTGNNTQILDSGSANNLSVTTSTSKNQASGYSNKLAAEAMAGAGAGKLGVAGALAVVVSNDRVKARIGTNNTIGSVGNSFANVNVTSTKINKFATRAWAAAIVSDATCSDPGNCESDGSKNAIGAAFSVIVTNDDNEAIIDEQTTVDSTGNVVVKAKDLRPSEVSRFALTGDELDQGDMGFTSINYTADLQNSSFYTEAIGGAAAQGGNAIAGSFAITIANDETYAKVGEGVAITAGSFTAEAINNNDVRSLSGAVALAEKTGVGISLTGTVLRTKVFAVVGDIGTADGSYSDTSIITSTGDITVKAEASQKSTAMIVAAGVSTSQSSGAGALAISVFDAEVLATVKKDTNLKANAGSVVVDADADSRIRSLAGGVGVANSNAFGGALALNLFLNDTQALIGAESIANNIDVDAHTGVNVTADNRQDLMNAVIAAAVSGSNAIGGALSVSTVKSITKAQINQGANVNQDATLDASATAQSVTVKAVDRTDVVDFTGAATFGNSTGVGIGIDANTVWKTTQASIDGTVSADTQVDVIADVEQNIIATVVGLAGGGSNAVGGSVGLMLIKNDTYALIEGNGIVHSDGNVKVHAEDDADVFFLTGGGGFGGSNGIAGAFGVTVHVGTTRAAVQNGASVTALGNAAAMNVVTGDITTTSQLFQSMNGDAQGENVGTNTRTDLTGRADSDSEDSTDDSISAKTVSDFITSLRSESKDTESRTGLAVTAFSDQDIISAAASLGIGGSNAVAVSLSAGVSANTTEAYIGSATINGSNASAASGQDVIVRAKADMNWIDISGAISGGGSVGVGLAGDVITQVKTTKAYIASGATVNAKDDVNVKADSKDRVVATVASGGGGGSVGVNGTAAIGVTVNTTTAYVDGTVSAGSDLTVDAKAQSELIQVSGAIGFGGSVGVGASFGVSVVKNTTKAYLGATAVTNASHTTRVSSDTDEIVRGVTFAGSGGGAVGVAFGMGVRVHQSTSEAYILSSVNQDSSYDSATQDVIVDADNKVHVVDVVGGISGGGTVGVGISANVLIIRNTASAYIGDGTTAISVDAVRDITVTADSDKTADSYMVAFGGGGVVGVGGAVTVIAMGALVDDDMKSQLGDGSDEGDTWSKVDTRTQTDLTTGKLVSSDDDHADAAAMSTDIEGHMTTQRSQGAIAASITTTNAGLNKNRTQAFIANNATADAGQDLIVQAGELSVTRVGAGAGAGGGVVGVGATIGLVMVDNTAEAFVGNSTANAGRKLRVAAHTQENMVGTYIAGGGAAITAVNGVVMSHTILSDSLAYIDSSASVNSDADGTDTQLVEVQATSATDVVIVGGSGGGAIVGVGVTGGALVIDKDTKASIGVGANVDSAGDVTVDASSRADVAVAAASVNGGVVAVTGVVAVQSFSNDTQAYISGGATVTAEDSIRVQATDDTEVDVIPIGGAGGAVGVAATFATNTVSNTTKAWVGSSTATTVQALGKHTGLAVADGGITNVTSQSSLEANDNDASTSNVHSFDKLASSFDNTTKRGLSIVAVSHEDVRTIPIGVAIGGVAVNGVVSTTVFDSTTEATVYSGVTVNGTNTGAGTNQDVVISAVGHSTVNSIATGIAGAAASAVAASLDTTIYKKVVRARMLGTVTVTQDLAVSAQSKDTLIQTVGSVAASGTDATAGSVGIVVIGSSVLAEIGASATAKAGRDIVVKAHEVSNITQVVGQSQTGGGVGLGLSLGIKVVKTDTKARIGTSAVTAAVRNTQVDAETDNNITQNVVAFGGGGIAAINGAVGINVIKTSTVAEIGASASINQDAAYNTGSAQDVSVTADDDISVLDNIGAVSIGGVAGVGIGLGVTVVRNTTQATIGNNAIVSARHDVNVTAASHKDIFNTAVAGAGGIGLGAAGSVSIALVGNSMSSDASSKLSNDNGSIVSEADTKMSQNRKTGYSTNNQTDQSGSDTSTAAGNANSMHASAHSKDSLIASETTGLAADINGTAADTTTAQIGVGASISAFHDVSVTGIEYVRLRQVAGGVALGAGAVGGWVAVTDYNANAQALVHAGATLNVDSDGNSDGDLTLTSSLLEDGGVSKVETVGGSAGLVGFAGAFSVLNFNGSAKSSLGYSTGSDVAATTVVTGAEQVVISSNRDVDSQVVSVGAAAGISGAGVSIATLNASGNSIAEVGSNVNLGASDARVGSVFVDADNTSTQDASATAAAVGIYVGIAGAGTTVSDSGTTSAGVGIGSNIYATGAITLDADDDMRNTASALGVTVAGGVSVGVVTADTTLTRTIAAITGDNVRLDTTSGQVNLTADAGNNTSSSTIRAAHAETTAGSGGLLAGINGTGATVVSNLTTLVSTGTGSRIEAAAQNVNLLAVNKAVTLAETTGFAVGAFALGAHNATSTNTATTSAVLGANNTLNTTGQLTLRSQADQNLLATTVAGAGGALAVNAATSTLNHISNLTSGVADSATSALKSSIGVGRLLVEAINNDDYDASLDATGVGIAQTSGGVLIANGTANVSTRIGNYTDLNTSAKSSSDDALTLFADNNLQKTGISGANFLLDGGGAFSVSVGTSSGTQTQNTDVQFGQYSALTTAGNYVADGSGNGDVSIRALNHIAVDDEAKVSTGGLVTVPRAKSVQVGIATADITFEDNASLTTQRGDVAMSASTSSAMDVRTRTSTWGLVGAGAQAESRATLTADDNITFSTGSSLNAHGFGWLYTGANHGNGDFYNTASTIVKTDSRIWNKSAIPISTGKISVATNTHNSNVTVASGATVQTQRHLKIKALKGDQQGRAFGAAYDWTTALTTRDTYGSASNTGATGINVAGTLATGLDKDVSIVFSKDFTPYFADGSGDSNKAAYTMSQNAAGEWELKDSGSNVVGTLNAQVTSSTGEVSWTVSSETLANDIDAEITRLTTAKSQYGTNRNNINAINQLTAEIQSLQDLKDGSVTGTQSYTEATVFTGILSDLNTAKSTLDALASPTSEQVTALSNVNTQIADIGTRNTKVSDKATKVAAKFDLDANGDNNADSGNSADQSSVDTYILEIGTLTTDIANLHISLAATANNISGDIQADINTLIAAESVALTDLDSDSDIDIDDLISRRTTLKNTYSSSTDAQVTSSASAIDDRIAELTAKKATLNTGSMSVLSINPVFAASGNLDLTAGSLTGTGSLLAPGDPSISITNNGSMVMKMGVMDIPDDPSGGVYFNDSLVTSAADINAIQSASNTLTVTSDNGVYAPSITVVNNYDRSSSVYNPAGDNHINNMLNPQLLISGAVNNIGGSITITNQTASIISSAAITGGTVTIASGGDVFLGSPNETYNVGASPTSDDGFGVIAGNKESAETCNASNASSCDYSDASTVQASEASYTVAGNNVFISGETINVNGLIQSGLPDLTLAVTQAEVTAAYDAAGSNQTYEFKTYRVAQSGSGSTRSVSGDNTVSDVSKLKVMYATLDRGTDLADTSDDVISINGTQVQGGQVVLSGRIASTGKGLINVVDGYGRINITNTSSTPVYLAKVDTGDFGTAGLEGTITFMDRQKTNGTAGVPLVTKYSRIGNNINEYSNVGLGNTTNPTALVSNSATGRSASYTPTDNLRYHWMGGTTVHEKVVYNYHRSGKKVFGVNAWDVDQSQWSDSHLSGTPTTTTLSPAALSAGEFVAVAASGSGVHQSGTDAAYAFSTTNAITIDTDVAAANLTDADSDAIDQNYFVESSTNGYNTWYCYLFFECWAWDAGKTQHEFTDNYYYHSVAADKVINLNFTGYDTGVVDVQSVGGIVLSSDIRNSNGTTSLVSSAGSIVNASSSTTNSIRSGDLTLTATAGDLGTSTNAIRLRQSAGNTVAITANNAYLKAPNGALKLTGSVNLSGTLDLNAHSDIDLSAVTDNLLTANTIRLRAQSGTINSGNAFSVNTDAASNGVFYARASSGNINVTETTGDLAVEEIRTVGNVTVNVTAGSLLDGNSVQTADELTQAQLAAMWADDILQLTNDAGNATPTAATIRKDDQIVKYNAAMDMLYVDYWTLRNVTASGSDYNADAYDENFSYSATTAEQTLLSNDSTAILNFESTQTGRYQLGHQKFGSLTYSPSFVFQTAAPTLDATATVALTTNYVWTEAELNSPIPNFGFKEITDTTMYIENANIIGANVVINTNASGGTIGKKFTAQTIDVSDLSALTAQQKLDLAAAEGSDVTYNATTQLITLVERDDIDIHASGNVTLAADQHVFVGGEENTALVQITAGDETQVKVMGNITNARGDSSAVITSNNLVLESGAGYIGTVAAPLRINQGSAAHLTARALNDINITELTGDVRVGAIYSPATVNLVSSGAIIDQDQDELQDIKALNINLTSVSHIGTLAAADDTDLQVRNKALEIASTSATTGLVNISRTGSAAVGANLYTPAVGGTGKNYLRLGRVDLNGSLTLSSVPAVTFTDSVTTLGGFVKINATGATDMTSTASIATVGGNFNADFEQSFTMANSASIAAQGGLVQMTSLGDMTLYDVTNTRSGASSITLGARNLTINHLLQSQAGDTAISTTAGLSLANNAHLYTQGGALTSTITGNYVLGNDAQIKTQAGVFSLVGQGNLTLGTNALIETGNSAATIALNTQTGQNLSAGTGSHINVGTGAFTLTSSGHSTVYDVTAGITNLTTNNFTLNHSLAATDQVDLLANGNVIQAANAQWTTQGQAANLTVKGDVDMAAGADILTNNGKLTVAMSDLINQDFRMASGAGINTGTGKVRIDTSGSMEINNIVSASNTAEAIYLSGFDILNSSDVSRDITLNSNGDIRLNAHRYIDLDGITYTGTSALDIEVSGVNTNALVAGARLEIDAAAGVNFSKSHVVRGVYVMPNSYDLTIADGKVNYDQFIKLNTVRGRVGRLDHHGIDFSAWGAAPNELDIHPNFADVGNGQQHFRITGDAASRATDTAVLGYSLGYSNASGSTSTMTTSAFMLQYDRSQIWVGGNAPTSQEMMQRILAAGVTLGRENLSITPILTTGAGVGIGNGANVPNSAIDILPDAVFPIDPENDEETDPTQPLLILQSADGSSVGISPVSGQG